MTKTRRLLFLLMVSICLAQWGFVTAEDIDGLSSKIDADLFLEDEGSGMGSRGMDDLEISGSGNGDDDEDTAVKLPPTPRTTPKSAVGPIDFTETRRKEDVDDLSFPTGGEGTNIFDRKEPPASFFSQPGILAAIICGAIVGLLCSILCVMFLVYRMRKKDEGSYVLDDSKRTVQSYGKAKEFFA